ncbi:MAG: SUMF1/EgtB/PvdO family nonheme iron enzyme, partial [Myxococcales bacterium]|nr:SUMF1/EgtB/PvdO family nonheme iron enzyme [Myxococcales bacterium]
HTVDLDGFWIMDVPMTWADDCRLRGWSAPPDAAPDSWPEGSSRFTLAQHHKVRRQYCEDEGGGYATRPLVAVAWQDAEALAAHLSTEAVQYGLPTESQWEKAARGGRIGARFPWGDGAPEPGWCDHDALHAFSIRDPRTTWRNGYGLYAMAGTVAEWTVTPYDALAYRGRPVSPEATERVLRGGSWADSLAGCTVSFRTSRASRSQLDEGWAPNLAPTLGYRLIRVD